MDKHKVIRHFGTKAKVAKALNISWEAVHKWPDKIPMRRAFELEIITDGKLKARFKVKKK